MSLKTLILIAAGVILVVCFAGSMSYFRLGLGAYSDRTSVRAVEIRGNALATFLARSLHEEWQNAQGFAASIDPAAGDDAVQSAIQGYSSQDGKVSWAGLARADGRVVAATDNLLVGADVSQRPWFQRGREGPFAGDVHEAVLLAQALNPDGDEPLRFIDFSVPVRTADGRLYGVFGVHGNWDWVQELLAEGAKALSLDAVLVNRGNVVLTKTDANMGDEAALANLASVRSAGLGVGGTFDERWPDGKDYFSTIVPDVGYEGLPSFGWSMVVRLDPAGITGARDDFFRSTILRSGLVLLMGLVAFALVAQRAFRPLIRLVDAVSRVSKGEDVGYVQESRAYREATRLSNAVSRLQSGRREDRYAERLSRTAGQGAAE